MAALNIKQDVLENIVGALVGVTSQEVLAGTDGLSKLVRENEGNEIMTKFADNCRKMQTQYNEAFVPATGALIEEYRTLGEFQGVIARMTANMTETRKGDSRIKADKVGIPEL